MTARYIRSDKLPDELVIIPPSTYSIECPPTGSPSDAYSLVAQGLPLPRLTRLLLLPSLPKIATRLPMCTQGESRSIRGIRVPPPKACRPSQRVFWSLITHL